MGEFHCHQVKVGNCRGGHSGVDIHHYRANAIKCLARLVNLALKFGAKLAGIRGGTAHNAIPMDAEACISFFEVANEKREECLV